MPVNVTHPHQTLIQPNAPAAAPKIDAPMPNMVQWSSPAPPKPQIQFSASTAAPRVRQRTAHDVAAPDIANNEKNPGPINVAATPLVNEQPRMPLSPMTSAATPANTRPAKQDAGAAPEVGAAGPADSDLHRVIALSAAPAPPAAEVTVPQGNAAARIAISPDGRQPGVPGGSEHGVAGNGGAGGHPDSAGGTNGGGGATHGSGGGGRECESPPAAIMFWAAVALILFEARTARAVPAFSRKYQTSCQTCHAIFPKLNPFGQAFRLNGYHLPEETEDQIKQKPVSLGAEAYERMWPEMVFPSDLPVLRPVRAEHKDGRYLLVEPDESGHQIIHNDFQFPQEVNLFAAGTLGKTFSFFGEITWAENPDGSSGTEIEHARIDVISPFGPEHLFNFRIGKLAPNLYDGFQEMWLMTDNGVDTLFTYNPIGFRGGTGLAEEGAGVSLPERARAIEMYGVAAHRLFYVVGIDQPIGAGGPNDTFGSNSHKDFYARVDYKIGGMGLDGDTTGVNLPPENWREKSLRLGVFGYTGDGTKVSFDVTDDAGNPLKMQDRRYNRYGVFASWYFGNLNVFGVALHGTDKLQLLDNDTLAPISETTRTYDSWFAQADYVIRPPFQISARYENLRVADPTLPTVRTLNANFSLLIRANIKAMLEYRRDLHNSQNYTLATVLRFAI